MRASVVAVPHSVGLSLPSSLHSHARTHTKNRSEPPYTCSQRSSQPVEGRIRWGGRRIYGGPSEVLVEKTITWKVWNIGSHAGPYFRNDRGSVELRKLQEKGDGSCLPDARILGTRVLCSLSYGLWEARIVSGWISRKNFGRTRLLVRRKIP